LHISREGNAISEAINREAVIETPKKSPQGKFGTIQIQPILVVNDIN
jgi:hypothetical protein